MEVQFRGETAAFLLKAEKSKLCGRVHTKVTRESSAGAAASFIL
jgi:hypothetical protein